MSSQGPLARHVADVRLGLEVMAQRDPRDPWYVPAPLQGPKPAAPVKVALAKIPGDMVTDRGVIALQRKAADHLADAGYAVSEVDVPDLNKVWQLWCDLIMTETRVLHQDQMLAVSSADFQKTFHGFIALANQLDQAGYMKAIAARSGHIRNWMTFLEQYPLVLMPTTVRKTPEVNADLGGGLSLRPVSKAPSIDRISSLVLRTDQPLDIDQLSEFMNELLEEHGKQLLRYKGVLNIAGEDRRLVFQGVLKLYGFDWDTEWAEGEARESVIVFIADELPEEKIRAGFARVASA